MGKTSGIIIGIVAAAMGIGGCGNTSLETVTYGQEESFALAEGSKDSLDIGISLEFPTGGIRKTAVAEIQKTLTATAFGQKFSGTDIEKAAKAWSEDEVRKYREENIGLWEKNGDDSGDIPMMILSWESIAEGHFLAPYKGMQSYIMYRYIYTGGAHGIDWITGLCFDLETGACLTQEDIFKPGFETVLTEALRKNLKKAFEDDKDTYDSLFTKDIGPDGNFYTTEDGITYIYGHYEIGPYSAGIIHVTVPWEEIAGILQ